MFDIALTVKHLYFVIYFAGVISTLILMWNIKK